MAINDKTDSFVIKYSRGAYPAVVADTPRFLQNEFLRLEAFSNATTEATIQVSDRAIVNPKRGMVRYAVDPWFPVASVTSGDTGLVVYTGSAWVLV